MHKCRFYVSAMTHKGQYRTTSCATRVARLKSLVCHRLSRDIFIVAQLYLEVAHCSIFLRLIAERLNADWSVALFTFCSRLRV